MPITTAVAIEATTEEEFETTEYGDLRVPVPKAYQSISKMYADRYGVPVEIVYGVMYVESGFDFFAVNGKCIGVMQINSDLFEWLRLMTGVNNLKNPEENIHAGVYILSKHYNGNWEEALVKYNCGEAGAKGAKSSSYSRAVMEYARGLGYED